MQRSVGQTRCSVTSFTQIVPISRARDAITLEREGKAFSLYQNSCLFQVFVHGIITLNIAKFCFLVLTPNKSQERVTQCE